MSVPLGSHTSDRRGGIIFRRSSNGIANSGLLSGQVFRVFLVVRIASKLGNSRRYGVF